MTAMIGTRCPICQSSNTQFLIDYVAHVDACGDLFKNCSVWICDGCQVAFAVPAPSDVELKAYYRSLYRSAGANTAPADERFPLDKLWYLSRGVAIAKLCIQFVEAGKLRYADIGAGYGHTIAAMNKIAEWELNSLGVEPDPRCWNTLTKVANTIIGDEFESAIPMFTEDCDIITLLHALEHFSDPVKVLKRIRGILKSQGILVIEVPNCPIVRTRSYSKEMPHSPHLFFFTPTSLAKALELAGYHILHLGVWGPELLEGCFYDVTFTETPQFTPPVDVWANPLLRMPADKIFPPFPVFSINAPNRLFLRAVARKIDPD